jgi:hypothetical protein
VVVAELAVVAELVDLLEAGLGHAGDFFVGGVDQVEEPGEGRTERQAAAALVADLGHAAQLALDLLPVEVVRIVVGDLGAGALGEFDLHGGGNSRRAMPGGCRPGFA